MRRTAIIFGTENSEHLRIERNGDEITFTSHELAPVSKMSQQTLWRDRHFATKTVEEFETAWQEVMA